MVTMQEGHQQGQFREIYYLFYSKFMCNRLILFRIFLSDLCANAMLNSNAALRKS